MATIDYIIERIKTKQLDFKNYNFTQTESNALTTFFDLAQEFDNIKDFYILCVFIPKVFFKVDAKLYLIDPKTNKLSLISKTEEGGCELFTLPENDVSPSEHPYYTANRSLVLTVRGKQLLIDQLPFETKDNVIGLLEIHNITALSPQQELFFEKFANRIGFNIHNKFIVQKNIEHLKFIRSLVADIEHNIITPNIVFKFYLNHLRKKIMKNIDIERLLASYSAKEAGAEVNTKNILAEITELNKGLIEEL